MSRRLEPRGPVKRFALEMERRLRANDHKGDTGWREESDAWLFEALQLEVKELEKAIDVYMPNKRRCRQIIHEAADVANFAMMIADVIDGYMKAELQGTDRAGDT